MMYNQLVRFDSDMNVMPELAESWPLQFMAVSLKPVGSLLVDST